MLGANLADEPPLRAVELALGVEGQLVVDVGHPGLADLGNKVNFMSRVFVYSSVHFFVCCNAGVADRENIV